MFASPLYMSTDLRLVPAAAREILLNAEVIRVSQVHPYQDLPSSAPSIRT
jgi:hypothetical protein